MERTVGLRCDESEAVFFLPREVWVAILKELSFRELWRLRAVSRSWMELAYAGVTVIPKSESRHVTDEQLKQMSSLVELGVHRENKTISDEGISGLLNLTHLEISGNDFITNDGISGLTNLRSLDLFNNDKITDTGLSLLTNLTDFDLFMNCKITNDGITHLVNLKRLVIDDFCGVTSFPTPGVIVIQELF